MMRSVWPCLTRWIQGARAGTISSWTTGPGSGGGSAVMIPISAKEIVFNVLEGAQALRRRVADWVVRGRHRSAPGGRPQRRYQIVRARIEHVRAVGDHD